MEKLLNTSTLKEKTMHAYSIDKKIRNTVSIVLFVISYSLSMILQAKLSPQLEAIYTQFTTWGLGDIVDFVKASGILPNVLEAAFIYWLISYAFEHWIWKCPAIRWIHKIPNLNGHWKGNLNSSYSDDPISMELEVCQTWSEISFKSKFPKSESYSNTAAIHIEHNRGVSIYFGFHNDSTEISTGMQSYDGYNILTLQGKNTITARYFNNRPNLKKNSKGIKGGNMGTFTLTREK